MMFGWSRSLRILTSLRSCVSTACRCFGSAAKVCFSITFTANGHSSRRRTAKNTLDAVYSTHGKEKQIKDRRKRCLRVITCPEHANRAVGRSACPRTKVWRARLTYWCLRQSAALTRSGRRVQLARCDAPIHPKYLPARRNRSKKRGNT